MKPFFQKLCFAARVRWPGKIASLVRGQMLSLQGMTIGSGTMLGRLYVNWPHKISIGRECTLERNVSFKYDGIWSAGKAIVIEDQVFIGHHCEFNISEGIVIGRYSNIASGCKFIDHDHGMQAGARIGVQPPVSGLVRLGQDVWLGSNVIVLKGVDIGDGAVIAAGAVVTRPVPSNEIWGGVPARKISERIKHGQDANHLTYFRG